MIFVLLSTHAIALIVGFAIGWWVRGDSNNYFTGC